MHNGQVVHLTPKSFEILLLLVENHGHVVEKAELLEKVWSGAYVEETNLTKNISVLRKILSEGGSGDSCIETFPKRGYRFNGPVRTENHQPPAAASPSNLSSFKRNAAVLTTIAVLAVIAFGFVYFYYFRG